MADGSLTRFLGDSPLRVLVRLVFLSFIVGVVMAALGLEPYDILNSLIRFFEGLWEMGFSAIDKALRYFLLGVVIVVPVWLIIRLTRAGRS
ncbi:DUF6460 domain-containing protein [Methylobrevis pamukkalensis]|uniref:DUF6460 domain-containing protein n=1 Tax=Methylobrevis pamukkalensis TaxID=1439726 RepID=A0A1E3H011_9HYPH|nr:DUF6460 domain-containing protein [Methylobrevis pamukkalensis]ODN69649.1 hypothetical protein A6302_03027 [Methylobrevis pamukkalensis]